MHYPLTQPDIELDLSIGLTVDARVGADAGGRVKHLIPTGADLDGQPARLAFDFIGVADVGVLISVLGFGVRLL